MSPHINPCQRVKKFKLDNERYRFLTPTEEADLMSWLVSPREHLEAMVIVALGFGIKKTGAIKIAPRPGGFLPQCRSCKPNQREEKSGDSDGCFRRPRKADSLEAL